jgi:hypothetical protein
MMRGLGCFIQTASLREYLESLPLVTGPRLAVPK